jgi:polar amino acid transport system permease protein
MIGFLLDGTWVTIQVTVLSIIGAALVGPVLGTARLVPRWYIRVPAATFVEVLRGTSAIVQLFFAFFALPAFGVRLSPTAAAVTVFSLNAGAYGSEIVRGGILTVPSGQIDAARALGMHGFVQFRRVVWPQAFVVMLPTFGNLAVELLKGTALVSLISLIDLTFQAQRYRSRTGETASVFLVTLLIYLVLALALSGAAKLAERWFGRWRERSLASTGRARA